MNVNTIKGGTIKKIQSIKTTPKTNIILLSVRNFKARFEAQGHLANRTSQ